jgi:polar amino acid transport system substrate-binding protein
MMKRIISVMLALVLVLFASLALADTFKMGIDAEYPPFSYLDDNGEYAGFDVEMCKAVCAMNGWDLEIVPINWDFKLISLDNMEHDCIWSGMTILDSMKAAGYVLSFPYYDSTQVILTTDKTGIKTLADLAGKRVAVQRGTSGDQLLQGDQAELSATFDGGAAITMDDFTVCITELKANGVDAVVVDLPVAEKHQRENADLVILEENLGSEQYGICFRKGDEELCKKVEESFMKLVEDGTYKTLAEKYGLKDEVLCLLNKAE